MTKKVFVQKNKIRMCASLDPVLAYRIKRFCVEQGHTVSGYFEAVLRADLDQRPEAKFPEEIEVESGRKD